MKVLFVSLNHTWLSQFGTELELMSKHIDKGDSVYILVDNGSLKSTISNQNDLLSIKFKSRVTFNQGVSFLDLPSQNIFPIKKKLSRSLLAYTTKIFITLDELKQFSLFGVNFGLAVTSSVISFLRDHQFDPIRNHEIVSQFLYTSLLVYESLNELIDRINPSLIYVYNGRHAESRPVVRLAQKLNIPFRTWARIEKIQKYLTFDQHIPQDIDYERNSILVTWDEEKNVEKKIQIAQQWFMNRIDKSTRLNNDEFLFDFTSKQIPNCLPSTLNHDFINIVIFNSSLDEYEAVFESGSRLFNTEYGAISKIIEWFEHDVRFRFYLRVHPNLKKLNNTQMRELKKLNYKNLEIIWPEDSIDTYALIKAATKVIVFNSTVGVEAVFLGKPVIMLDKASYEGLNCCYVPQDEKELMTLVAENISPKRNEGALKYGYWQEMKGKVFEKFQPEGFYSGKFLGKSMIPEYSFMQRMKLSFYNRIDNRKMMKIKQLSMSKGR